MKKKYFDEKPLRALLLSAGFGSRLKPITDKKPKCLVEIDNKPILDHWLLKLEEIGCEKALINTHYLSEQVDEFLLNRNNTSMDIKTTYEEKLLGTAGTLIKNFSFFKNSKIIMMHVDNMTNFDIQKIIDFHNQRQKDNCLLTMLTFRTDSPSNCGIVVVDEDMILKEFHEKIMEPPTNIANGAIYLFDYNFLEWLEKKQIKGNNISNDVLPLLKKKIQSNQQQTN